MSDNKTKIQTLDELIAQLKDVHHSCVALVEKLAAVQLKAMETGLDRLSDSMGKPFSSISGSAKLLEEILQTVETQKAKSTKEAEGE